MNVSIIITFYNGINILCTCISKIVENTQVDGKIEIVIINDNPAIEIFDSIKPFSNKCDISLYTMNRNSGYSCACNQGVRLAKYDYIVLMDCDIFPEQNWLNNIIISYEKQINPGSVSSKIIEAETGKLFGYGIGIHGVDIILFKRHGNQDCFSQMDRNFSMISSGCLFMEKKLYMELGGQDENFYNADNDLDLTFRIFLLGKSNTICSNSLVYHRGHVSGNVRVLPSRLDSKAWLFRKWGTQLSQNTLEVLLDIFQCSNVKGIPNSTILVNFSNSLCREDYYSLIAEAFHTTFVQKYDFKNVDKLNQIYINDFLSWDMCRTNIPIIYFTDDYRNLNNNAYWFNNRRTGDYMVDINGNVFEV